MDILASNDKVRYDYEILETVEAGLVLTGQEVKSAKGGHLKLKGAYVTFHNGEAWLTGGQIAKYPKAGPLPHYDPDRSRKLLLRKRELDRLRGKRQEEGLTIVPIRAYIRSGRIKLEIGVGRGKKQYEKRESIKKRDLDRQARAAMKIRR